MAFVKIKIEREVEMLGVIVNSLAVILGSLLGLVFKKGISEKINKAVMVGIGLCIIYIGIDGTLCDANPIVAVISIVAGAIIGTLLDIDKGLNNIGNKLSAKLSKDNKTSTFTEGFVTSSLLFCVGAMAIMGSITAGLTGDNTTLYTKSILDFISAIMLSSTLGIGVLFSFVPLTLYQGAIALCAGFLEPLLSDGAVNALSCVGSLLILALGLNLVGIPKIKVANYLPAVILAPFIFYLFELILKGAQL